MGGSNSLGIFLILSCSISLSIALSFNMASFESTKPIEVECNGDASISGAGLDLNREATSSAGRALYRKPLQLWVIDHGNTAMLADFSTHFAFEVSSSSSNASTNSSSSHGDGGGGGFSFVMVPDGDQNSTWPNSSYGGLLGLFGSNDSALDLGGAGQQHPLVAVEFDEGLDPAWDFSSDHVGIDVNSLKSKRYVNLTAGTGFINNGTANVWVDYNSTSKNLSVSFSGNLGSVGVFHIVDLRDVLPQRVRVGFTASTGSSSVVIHRITSWSFTSPDLTIPIAKMSIWRWVGASLVVVVFVLILVVVGLGGIGICLWRRYSLRTQDNDKDTLPSNRVRFDQVHYDQDVGGNSVGSDQFHHHQDIDQMFSLETVSIREILVNYGVKVVPYDLILKGTNHFHPDSEIGEGGSGAVYHCRLSGPERDVAVKKIKSGFRQRGQKEFLSELTILCKATHDNAIRLVCCSLSTDSLCLCFELMPNGSLDRHLHGEEINIPPLDWENRCKVMVGVALGLAYLHTDLEKCVIHRDIKSANVLLDAQLNAKVADFGAARYAERNRSIKTTTQIGTPPYAAPEVLSGGKASTQSDVYSFGMLLLEAVTGSRPGERGVLLVPYVKGKDNVVAAVDERLGDAFDVDQAKLLLDVALLCCQDDPLRRPSMRGVVRRLTGNPTLQQGSFSFTGHSSTAAVAPPRPRAVSHFRRNTIA